MHRDFRITPLADELSSIERELSFAPSATQAPQVLTREQVDQYNREGFLTPLPVYSTSEIDEIRSYFDNLLQEVLARGEDAYSISSAHLKYGEVYDILTDDRIVGWVSDLLGDHVVAWGSHFFCKLPGDPKQVAWHQDASYWPLTPSRTVTVWLAIDDADTDNGCMQLVPRSHLHGHIEYRESESGEANVLDQTIDDVQRFGRPVDNVLKAGQASVHSDLLLHGSNANLSDRRRCGLTLRYCTTEVRAHLNWHEKGVIVRGNDPSGHWKNPTRP